MKNARTVLNTDLTIAQTIEAAQGLWSAYDLDADLDTAHLLIEVAQACEEAGLSTINHLLTHAGHLLEDLTGLTSLTEFTSREVAATLNAYRNTLHALLWSAALQRHEQPATALGRLPKVTFRSTNKRRHLDDDEILLLRLDALSRALTGGSAARPATQYALIETASVTSEIEYVKLGHFDDPTAPRTVRLCGNDSDVQARDVSLAAWARKVLAITLPDHMRMRGTDPEAPVAYLQEAVSENPNPAAAVGTNMARSMKVVGLGVGKHRPEPHSILRWKLTKTRDTEGIAAAVERSGRADATALYTFLTMEKPRTSPRKSRKHTGSMLGQ